VSVLPLPCLLLPAGHTWISGMISVLLSLSLVGPFCRNICGIQVVNLLMPSHNQQLKTSLSRRALPMHVFCAAWPQRVNLFFKLLSNAESARVRQSHIFACMCACLLVKRKPLCHIGFRLSAILILNCVLIYVAFRGK